MRGYILRMCDKYKYDFECVDLVALYIGGGNLYGASDEKSANTRHYWGILHEAELHALGWELVRLAAIPRSLAELLMNQGTSIQWFCDGYSAANHAALYVSDTIDSEPAAPFCQACNNSTAYCYHN